MTITFNRRAFLLTIILLAVLMFAGTPEHRISGHPTVAAQANAHKIVTEARPRVFGENESARSDKITGGSIEKAALISGNPEIKITVNLPAFLLTLWQEGKEVETYAIGIGRKSHSVVIGERHATDIIYNPGWIPPDSPWARRSGGVRPGQVIKPSDPRNPLGKLKIPLGEAYLIHQAAKPSDIGRLVSHGCVRMLEDDLFDPAERIIVAHGLDISNKEMERAKKTDKKNQFGQETAG